MGLIQNISLFTGFNLKGESIVKYWKGIKDE